MLFRHAASKMKGEEMKKHFARLLVTAHACMTGCRALANRSASWAALEMHLNVLG